MTRVYRITRLIIIALIIFISLDAFSPLLYPEDSYALSLKKQKISFSRISNARDLGGYRTESGQYVKKGLLIRSGELSYATKKDIKKLRKKYSLNTIIDLRYSGDHKYCPDKKIKGVKNISIPTAYKKVYDRKSPSKRYKKLKNKKAGKFRKEAALSAKKASRKYTYRLVMSKYSKKAYRRYFRVLLQGDDKHAILFHCIHGKDRTGVAAFMTLVALGVNENTAYREYDLTNDYMETCVKGRTARKKLGVKVSDLKYAVKRAKKKYGSLRKFLNKAYGLNSRKLKKLRRIYVSSRGDDHKDEPEPPARSPLADTTVRFYTPVNVSMPASRSKQDVEYETDLDPSVLMLPHSYTDDGDPTRLIIWCHGAGGTVDPDDSITEKNITAKYLVANGYAVLDVNGLPFAYADKYNISRKNNIGNPIAIQSYINAYHYVIDNYNIRKDGVFAGGISMGGISSANLVMSEELPVIAHGALCPVLDTFNEIWQHPWEYSLPKAAMAQLYGFDKLFGRFMYSESKVNGYNPVNNNTVYVNGEKGTKYPCPVKLWHCVDDSTVDAKVTFGFVQQIKTAGGTVYLSNLPYGNHDPESVGEVMTDPSGNTDYRGEKLQVKKVTDEVLLWFNSFS